MKHLSMLRTIKFAKLARNWYVILPDYPMNVENLEMVAGADDFLDSVADNKSIVICTVSEESFNDAQYHMIALQDHNGPTGYYRYGNETLWLCGVNKYFWGGSHPDNIFVRVDNVI